MNDALLAPYEMDLATRVQILDEAVYILHSDNTLEKCMKPFLLPPAIVKY